MEGLDRPVTTRDIRGSYRPLLPCDTQRFRTGLHMKDVRLDTAPANLHNKAMIKQTIPNPNPNPDPNLHNKAVIEHTIPMAPGHLKSTVSSNNPNPSPNPSWRSPQERCVLQ